MTDELGAIVQAPVPGDDRSGFRDMRLCFASGFLRRMECAVQDADVRLRIGPAVIRAIRSDDGLHFFEVVAIHRFAIEIPSSELHAHIWLPTFTSRRRASTDRARHTFPACTVYR